MVDPCSACRFWVSPSSELAEQGQGGRCRRFPPSAVWGVNVRGDQIARTEWPRTYHDDGCGEHQALASSSPPASTAAALPKRKRR